MRRACVVGYGAVPVGKHKGVSVLSLYQKVFYETLRQTKVPKKDIEGLFVIPEGFFGFNVKMLAPKLAQIFDLELKSLCRYEIGGASSLFALFQAAQKIRYGELDVAVVLAAETMQEEIMQDFQPFMWMTIHDLMGLYGPYLAPYGFTSAVSLYAFGAQRYMEEFGVSEEDIAYLSVVLRENAALNPYAAFTEPLTLEQVMQSRMISPPIKLLECTKFLAGAACVVLTSEEYALRHNLQPVFVEGIGEIHDNSHFIPFSSDKPLHSYPWFGEATRMALKEANLSLEQIDVAEIYGVFNATELMMYEDIGFFEKGKAAEAVKKGLTRRDGQVGLNLSGGRISMGHPPACTPLYEVIEIYRQLTGTSQNQRKNARRGLVHAEHGMVNGALIGIFAA